MCERLADTRSKSDCLLLARLANLSLAVSDCRLQQHLEGVVEQDEYGFGSPPIPRPIEVLDGEHQRIDRLAAKLSNLLPHGPPVRPPNCVVRFSAMDQSDFRSSVTSLVVT